MSTIGEEVSKVKKNTFTLPNKKVKIMFNPNNPGPIKNPKHIAYFKLEKCFDKFPCATSRNGQLKNPFTNEEKEYLEAIIDRGPNSLSIYNKEGYLRDFDLMPIRLGKDPLILDLSDPHDYIQYKILLTYTDTICPDYKLLKTKKTYKYYVRDEESVAEVKKLTSNKNKRAWSEYGKMSENKNKMIAFLKVYSQFTNKSFLSFNVNSSTKLSLIDGKISDIVSSDMDTFLKIIEHPEYDTILLIAEAVELGEIQKQGTKYFLRGGTDKLGDNLERTIEYLNAPVNQEMRLMLETSIKNK